jgi:hypothetical protein
LPARREEELVQSVDGDVQLRKEEWLVDGGAAGDGGGGAAGDVRDGQAEQRLVFLLRSQP